MVIFFVIFIPYSIFVIAKLCEKKVSMVFNQFNLAESFLKLLSFNTVKHNILDSPGLVHL